MDNFILNPNLKVTEYAGAHYLYDARVIANPLVEILTQTISPEEYSTLRRLKTQGFFLEARSRKDILAYFSDERFAPDLFDNLLRRNLLKQSVSRTEALQSRVLEFFNARYAPREERARVKERPPFEVDDDNLRSFGHRTFFNLPRQVDPEASHVGLLGIPHASLTLSLGTEAAPFHFRQYSRSLCWFDIHEHGVYSETNLGAGGPGILCKDVVMRDCGDLDFQDMTLSRMTGEVRRALTREFLEHNTSPLIIGGDHAITYPIVLTYLEAFPELGLLHLDAHNDLFYTPKVEYNHAAPISNLVRNTDIERVVSFGLRTFGDSRVHNVRSFYEKSDSGERLRLYSLISMKQLLMTGEALESELEALADRPYYLTVDLDVLSESAIGRQLSTPLGAGIEWHELFYFLDVAFRKLNVIGCDIVEYDATQGAEGGQNRGMINSLLLLITDGLARSNTKRKRAPELRA